MKTKDSLKLKVFESSLPKEDVTDLIAMIESASTIDDIDHIHEVFNEKVKEIPYSEAAIIASNKKIIAALKESEIASECKDVIAAMEEYNNELSKLWKKGVCPKNDRQKYMDIWDRYMIKSSEAMDKIELKLKMKVAEITAKNVKVSSDEVDEVKKQLDMALDFKKKVKEAFKDMKSNLSEAAEKVAQATKTKADELKEKIDDLKKKDAE